MGTLQSELSKVITEWSADDDKQTQEQAKMHISKTVFEYIRDNEGRVAKEVIDAMAKLGIKRDTVEALITQMQTVKMIVKDDVCGELFAKIDKYEPIKSFGKKNGTLEPIQKKKKVYKASKKTKATPKPSAVPVLTDLRSVKEWHPDDVLADLSVMQARKLYDALMAIFTGKPV
jgi:hypothetical protein